MAIIVKTKCGNCNTLWSRRVNQVRVEHGPPKVKCNSCGHINTTGMKWAKDMSEEEKRNLWLKTCFKQGVLWIFLLGVVFFLFGIESNNPIGGLLFCGGAIAYAVYILIALGISYDNEKEAAEIYESNGGYVTSYFFVRLYD